MTRYKLQVPDGYLDDPFSYTIRRRLSRDENTMIVALGQPRRGKSYAIMTIAEMNDARHDFDAEHVTFLPQDYLDKISHSHKGCFIIFDEPGAEWSSRRFMSIENVLLSATHITFGSKLINVAWAVPNMKQQDVNAVRLLNYSLVMKKSPFHKGTAKLYYNSANEMTGKQYRYGLGMVNFALPFQDNPDELKKYEEAKKDYQDEKYEEYYQRFLEKNENKVEKNKLEIKEIEDIVKQVISDPLKYSIMTKGKSKLNIDIIQHEASIKKMDAKTVYVLVKKMMQDRGVIDV